MPGLHAEGVSETKTTTQSHTHSVKNCQKGFQSLVVRATLLHKIEAYVPKSAKQSKQMCPCPPFFHVFLYFNQANHNTLLATVPDEVQDPGGDYHQH